MKPLRSLLVCALALPLVFSACEQQDNLGLDEAGIIRLSASTEGTSRGMPLGAASELTSMGVFCYHTQGQAWAAVAGSAAANRMNNTAWTQSEGTWTSNATVAWEPTDGYNDNFSFFGYTPRGTADNGITVSSTTGTPKLTYTVPAIIGNQPDLMVASAKDVKPTSSAVNMAYKHALTCVAFKGIGAGETISAIKVKGVKTTGTLSLDASSGITWTNLGGELSTEFSAGLSNPGGVVTDGTATGVLAADGYLMMIPQTLTADAKVVVTINNTDYTFALQTAEVSAWAAGQRVTYTINTDTGGFAWAGSNIYWDGTKLTFDAPHVTTHEAYQGVFFKWGSLIGISPQGDFDASTTKLFMYTGGSWTETTATARGWNYVTIPYYLEDIDSNSNRAIGWLNDNSNASSYAQFKGDICMYLQSIGAAPSGNWRIPTSAEHGVHADWDTVINGRAWTMDNSLSNLYGTSTAITNGRRFQGSYYFPASGYRNIDGTIDGVGSQALYWSSTYSTDGSNEKYSYSLFFTSNGTQVNGISNFKTAMPIRCVRY